MRSGSLHFIQFGEDVCEANEDRRVRDTKYAIFRLDEAAGRSDVADSLDWIDGPNLLDAHAAVVIDAFLQILQGVILRQDLYTKKRRLGDDRVLPIRAMYKAQVWNPEARCSDLHPLFGEGPQCHS